jgi:hypothetical protein
MQLLGGARQQHGLRSLLDDLRDALANDAPTELIGAFSYVNASGTQDLFGVTPSGLKITAIAGGGAFQTSRQAADLFLTRPDAHLILYFDPSGRLFHPKVMALYQGRFPRKLYVGSSNLTAGGLRNNVETNLQIDLATPTAAPLSIETDRLLRALGSGPSALRVRPSNVARLTARGHLYDENLHPRGGRQTLGAFVPDGRFSPDIASAPVAFVMTLGHNDVSAIHHDNYFLVPKAARDEDPAFWGWPTRYTGTSHRSRTVTIRTELPGGNSETRSGRIYLLPSKTEFRVTSQPIHQLGPGAIGWIVVARWMSSSLLRLQVIDPASPDFVPYRARCSTTAHGGMKHYGYV